MSVYLAWPCTRKGRGKAKVEVVEVGHQLSHRSQATKGSLNTFIKLNNGTCLAKGLQLGRTLESPWGCFKNADAQDLCQTH